LPWELQQPIPRRYRKYFTGALGDRSLRHHKPLPREISSDKPHTEFSVELDLPYREQYDEYSGKAVCRYVGQSTEPALTRPANRSKAEGHPVAPNWKSLHIHSPGW
jgi:hypothetical protein